MLVNFQRERKKEGKKKALRKKEIEKGQYECQSLPILNTPKQQQQQQPQQQYDNFVQKSLSLISGSF